MHYHSIKAGLVFTNRTGGMVGFVDFGGGSEKIAQLAGGHDKADTKNGSLACWWS